jgi:hypothetical protein
MVKNLLPICTRGDAGMLVKVKEWRFKSLPDQPVPQPGSPGDIATGVGEKKTGHSTTLAKNQKTEIKHCHKVARQGISTNRNTKASLGIRIKTRHRDRAFSAKVNSRAGSY